MAFPETSVVSTFTGSDGSTPVTGFSLAKGEASAYFSNQGTIDVSADSTNYWDAGTYTQPVDIHLVVAAYHAPSGTSWIGPVLIQSPGATFNGYGVIYYPLDETLSVCKYISGSAWFDNLIGTSIEYALAEGELLGMRLHTSGTIDVWTKLGAGAWTLRGSRGPDTTYTGEFYGGYACGNSTGGGGDGDAVDDLNIGEAIEDEGGASTAKNALFGCFGGPLRGKL